MNNLRLLAGVIVGAGALILLWRGEYTTASALLGSMLGFFVGEKNGERTATKNKKT